MSGTSYQEKPTDYFAGARRDFVELLAKNPAARILEIGCGDGSTGRLALAEGVCGEYVGVELFEDAAARARPDLTRVIQGDIEKMTAADLGGPFDAVIASEVLEHLQDPWAVVRALADQMRPGAVFMASSPNIAHHKLLKDLLKGRWDYELSGVMDVTHVRWFTPFTYAELFQRAGLVITRQWAMNRRSRTAKLVNWLSRGRLDHLFTRQIAIVARKP